MRIAAAVGRWGSGATGRVGIVLVTIAVVLVGVLSVGVVRLDRSVDDHDVIAANRAELRAQAGRIVAEVFSVRADRWVQDRARARALVGDGFRETYGAQLSRPPADGTAEVTWNPEEVGLVTVGVAAGEALVRVTVTTRTTAAAQHPHVAGQSVLARFTKADGRWLLQRADVVG